jgi:hypothetical protein
MAKATLSFMITLSVVGLLSNQLITTQAWIPATRPVVNCPAPSFPKCSDAEANGVDCLYDRLHWIETTVFEDYAV